MLNEGETMNLNNAMVALMTVYAGALLLKAPAARLARTLTRRLRAWYTGARRHTAHDGGGREEGR